MHELIHSNYFKPIIERLTADSVQPIDLIPEINGTNLMLYVRTMKNLQAEPVILVDIVTTDKRIPIGHYDWVIKTDSPPLPPYANGNVSQRKHIDSINNPQHGELNQVDKFWQQNTDAVEVSNDYRGNGLGSLMVAISTISIAQKNIPHVCVGGLSPLAKKLWNRFNYQQFQPANPFGRGLSPYSSDYVDLESFLPYNQLRIEQIFSSKLKNSPPPSK